MDTNENGAPTTLAHVVDASKNQSLTKQNGIRHFEINT